MTKDELVHLYTPLGCVAAHLAQRDIITAEALAVYEASEVTPTWHSESRENGTRRLI